MLSLSDRERQQAREKALKERRLAQREAVREEPVPFFPPIKARTLDNDAASRKIANVLGEYDAVKSSILKGDIGLIGVDKMPATPAPSRFQDEDIDTALPRVVPTPEKVVDLFATPQKRAPVSSRHSSLSGQKNGGLGPVRPSPIKPPGSSSKVPSSGFGQYSAAPSWSATGETPTHDLEDIFKNMATPCPIQNMAPTPARNESFSSNRYFQDHQALSRHSSLLDQELTISDSESELDMDLRRPLPHIPRRPLSPFANSGLARAESPDHRRSLGLNSLPSRPLSPFKSIRIPSPVHHRMTSPNHRKSLGLIGLPSRPLSPFRSIRVPSPVHFPVRMAPPVVRPSGPALVSPRGPSNTAAEPMEISSEGEDSGDSSSESEEEVKPKPRKSSPAKPSPRKPSPKPSPKNQSETSPAHTPSWGLGNFIKTTPLAQSIHGDMSDNGPPSEPQVSELKEGPLSVTSLSLSQIEDGQPLTPASFGLGEPIELSSQTEVIVSDGEMFDICRAVKEFKVSMVLISPLRDSDSEQEKKPFPNLLRAVEEKGIEKRPSVRSVVDSDLDSKAPKAVKHSPRKPALITTLLPLNSDAPRNLDVLKSPKMNAGDTQPKMDQNKSKSICQIFRQKGKLTPKQEPVTFGKENVPVQNPVIQCSIKLGLLCRVPRKISECSVKSNVDAVIDEIACGNEPSGRIPEWTSEKPENNPDLSEGEIESDVARTLNFALKKRNREPSTSTVSSDSENEYPVHRKEDKRKRLDDEEVQLKKLGSPAFASQSTSHASPSFHLSEPTNHERTEKGIPSPFVDADQPASRLEPGFPQSGATVESGYESLPGMGYEQEIGQDWGRNWQPSNRMYFSYYEMMKMEADPEPDERDQNENLMEAKRLKHLADRESDKVVQFILYMEAAMFFIQTGVSMDTDGTPNKGTQNMYKETNNLIKHISSKFRNQELNTPQGMVLARLMVLSMKAQAILQLKLFSLKRVEVREGTRMINEFFAKENNPIPVPDGIRGSTNSPSSPTPSPAGSMNSVGSHSSGQGDVTRNGFQNGSRSGDTKAEDHGQQSPMIVPIPPYMHTILTRQHHNVGLLQACHDLWEQADTMVMKTRSEDFFIQLDQEFGPLTLHSSLRELVRKVRAAVEKLGNFYRDNSNGREPIWP